MGNQSKASIMITTPFKGFNKFTLNTGFVTDPHYVATLTYNLDDYSSEFVGQFSNDIAAEEPLSLSLKGSVNEKKITLDFSVSNGNQPNASIVIKTPFKGFNELNLNASLATDPVYTATLAYQKDSYSSELKVKFSQGYAAEDAAEDSAKQPLIFRLEGRLEEQKVVLDASVVMGNQPRASIVIKTPIEGFSQFSLNASFVTDPNYVAALTYSRDGYFSELEGKFSNGIAAEEPLSLSLKGSVNEKKITLDVSVLNGNQPNVSIVIKTPFKGFNELSLSAGLVTDPDYVAALIYNQDGYSSELKGKFTNGIATEEPLTVSLEGSINEQKINLDVSLVIGNQLSLSIAIKTPFDLLRYAKLTAFNKEDFTFRLENSWVAAIEYNDHKVTFQR